MRKQISFNIQNSKQKSENIYVAFQTLMWRLLLEVRYSGYNSDVYYCWKYVIVVLIG